MDLETFLAGPLPAIAAVAGLGATSLLFFGRGRRPEPAQPPAPEPLEPLPSGAVYLTTGPGPRAPEQSSPDGRIMLVGFGTFGANRVLDVLRTLALSGLDRAIGSVFLVELDAAQRGRFLTDLPACFREKLSHLEIPALAGGLANKPPSEVRATIATWGPDLARATERACRNHSRLQHGREPALCLVFISPGAHATIGTVSVADIASHFRRTQFVGLSALPADEALRVWVPGIIDAYRRNGLASGLVLADNRRDQVANDWGMTSLIAGALAAAASDTGAVIHLNNLWSLALAEAPGRVGAYSTHVRRVPVYPHRRRSDAPLLPYCYAAALRSAIEIGLEEVDREESHSLAGLGDGPGERVTRTSRFRLVLVPVDGDTLVAIEDDIRAGQQMRGVAVDPNDHLLFAPIAEAIDLSAPDPSCSVTVVALRGLSDGDAALNELASPQTALHSHPGGADGRVKEDIGADHAVLH